MVGWKTGQRGVRGDEMLRIGDRHQAYGNAWVTTQQTALMLDLSTEGVRIRSESRLDPGSFTHVQLELPDGSGKMRCRCRVVWCKACDPERTEYLAGLEFVDMSAADRDRLAASRRPPSPPAPPPDDDDSLA